MLTLDFPGTATRSLKKLLDLMSDAVLLLDRQGRVSFANTAALRLPGCEPGMDLTRLSGLLGEPAVDWVRRGLAGAPGGHESHEATLADGRKVQVALHPMEHRQWALRLQAEDANARPGAPQAPLDVGRGEGSPAFEMVRTFWASPFPVTVQGVDFRLVDVNRAYLDFTGYSREKLIGTDPINLQPEEDHAERLARRSARMSGRAATTDEQQLVERRLIDASGHERWYRAARREMRDARGQLLYIAVFQDCTAEHVAREQAERSLRELDQWFDLTPVGMLLFDQGGLVVRNNPEFEALVGTVPVLLSDSSPALQQLLGWTPDGPSELIAPGAAPLERHVRVEREGRLLSLRAKVRCYETRAGQWRYMAVVDDQSVTEERDLARMQIGALMDTAGVGLATFQESVGWAAPSIPSLTRSLPADRSGVVRERTAAGARKGPPSGASSAALQAIGRDMVVPDSAHEYERLQHAIRHAERAEARYGIQHPELGLRWLLTRVEPGQLASGTRTASVVTLDITELQAAQARSDELLHELATILDSSTAGIAYVRGSELVRCNRRFERLLGLPAGSAIGKDLRALLAGHPEADRIARESDKALSEGWVYETEFKVASTPRSALWRSLSVRRTGPKAQGLEAIAVLSDISRLKMQQTELEVLARDRELMFSLSEVGIGFLRDGRVQRANGAFAQMAGYQEADMTGMSLDVLFPPDALQPAQRQAHAESLRLTGRWIGERRMRRRDGSLLWVQVGERLVRASDPAGGIIASFVNVDARHRAELALSVQAERTRAVLDSVLVGIVTVGASGIEWLNRAARRMFAGDMSDFVGRPIVMLATSEPEHPLRQPHHADGLAEGQARTFECRVVARNGRAFWVAGNVVATGGVLTYALMDIEQRRQAEVRIAETQASLQRILEMAPLGIALRDARSLRVVQINKQAAAMVGRPVDAVIGTTPEEVHDKDLAWRLRGDLLAALDSTEPTQHEYRMPVDGAVRVYDARYLPLANRGAAPDQILMVATDVTEQRAAQEARFEAAIAQRDMLVKEVHHRIKNNLQGVAGLLQQIGQRKPEVAAALAEVVSQVQAIAQVYGLQVGASGSLRVPDVIAAITGSVQRTFGRVISLTIHGEEPQRWILPEAESIPIALTVNELLTNAVKHSAHAMDEPVRCDLVCGEGDVEINIANPGSLPEGFTLSHFPGGVSGLGLVRALLPRRSARLSIEQKGSDVVAAVHLQPPGIQRVSAS